MGRERDKKRRRRRSISRSRSESKSRQKDSTDSYESKRKRSERRNEKRKDSQKRKKDSNKDKSPKKVSKFESIRRKLSQLSSFSQSSSEDSEEKRHRKRRQKKKIHRKYYRKSESEEDDPLKHYKRRINTQTSIYSANTDEHGNRVTWDGFRWVEKGASMVGMDQAAVNHTKKMRRVQISNLPIYLGLRQEDIQTVIQDFIISNYLNDEGNKEPVIECELNSKARTAVVELSSIEEATRFSKVNMITILGVQCKVTRVGESMYGATTNIGSLLKDANTQAKAQAVAFEAIDLLTQNGVLNLDKSKKLNLVAPMTNIVKVMNLCDVEQARLLSAGDFDKMLEDMLMECSKKVKLVNAFIVKNHIRSIGAEPGSIFLELESKDEAEKLMEHLVDKKYENRKFHMVCVPEQTYRNHFLRLQV